MGTRHFTGTIVAVERREEWLSQATSYVVCVDADPGQERNHACLDPVPWAGGFGPRIPQPGQRVSVAYESTRDGMGWFAFPVPIKCAEGCGNEVEWAKADEQHGRCFYCSIATAGARS